MPTIKPSCINTLKERVNIVDVVGRVVTLRKAGSRYKALCPFHPEKTPSFNVDPNKGFYKCFGCGKAGDAISFVRETERLTFAEAVEQLCNRFNIPVEYEEGRGPSREERSLRGELFAIHDIATGLFHAAFREGVSGGFFKKYWVETRRFSPELAEEFKIGAADPNGGGLFARLHKEGFSEEAIRKCGLFFIRDNEPLTLRSVRPRFRGRLMIPIRDHQGRVVAFTARQTDLTPENDPAREAKYVNSPETPVFTKGDLLFNLDRARSHAGDDAPFLLVEGQLDAIRCWSVGLKTAVAPQGTSITEEQLRLARRYSGRLECLFDGDKAGQAAALRLLPLALKNGIEVSFLPLAGAAKVDPDALFLREGAAAINALRSRALGAMAFACRSLLPEPAAASAEAKTRVASTLFEIIAGAESLSLRAQFLDEIARHLRIPANALREDFALHERRRQHHLPTPPPAAASPAAPRDPAEPRDSTELHLLRLCLCFEDVARLLARAFGENAGHDWIDKNHTAGALLDRFLTEIEFGHWPGANHLDGLLENDRERQLVASLLFEKPDEGDNSPKWFKDYEETRRKVALEGFRELRRRTLDRRKTQIELAQNRLDPDSDFDQIKTLETQRLEILRQLRAPCELPAAD